MAVVHVVVGMVLGRFAGSLERILAVLVEPEVRNYPIRLLSVIGSFLDRNIERRLPSTPADGISATFFMNATKDSDGCIGVIAFIEGMEKLQTRNACGTGTRQEGSILSLRDLSVCSDLHPF